MIRRFLPASLENGPGFLTIITLSGLATERYVVTLNVSDSLT